MEDLEKGNQICEFLKQHYQQLNKERTTKNEERTSDDAVTRGVSKQQEEELLQKNEIKANENLELSELLVEEKRFSVDIDNQLREAQTTLLGLQSDWGKLQHRYKELKVDLTTVRQLNDDLHAKIQRLSARKEGVSRQHER
ncbi:unnamed protein product [Pleuronectes platessa]|uniref:Uncharacterized protein n=1 Tax=Pleuronectes platessa TaxID=8262 RepID=A0A9N7Z272_PLEPL|nr:unnamed protein product [Pleuronectes platessa]